jgi:hypothetical protein
MTCKFFCCSATRSADVFRSSGRRVDGWIGGWVPWKHSAATHAPVPERRPWLPSYVVLEGGVDECLVRRRCMLYEVIEAVDSGMEPVRIWGFGETSGCLEGGVQMACWPLVRGVGVVSDVRIERPTVSVYRMRGVHPGRPWRGSTAELLFWGDLLLLGWLSRRNRCYRCWHQGERGERWIPHTARSARTARIRSRTPARVYGGYK